MIANMTYPDLINDFINKGGGILLFLGVLITILTFIISMSIKYFVLPKVKAFLNSIDMLICRIEKSERRIEMNESRVNQVEHNIDKTNLEVKNTREVVERMAKISEQHINKMELTVANLEDLIIPLVKDLAKMEAEHKANHKTRTNK